MQARRVAAVALAALALMLGGCVVSERPLFDPASAVLPAAAGRYEKQQRDGERWVRARLGTLAIEGRLYRWKGDDETDDPTFSVYPAGTDSFVVHARIVEKDRPEHYYALAQKIGQGYEFYQPTCSDLRKALRLPTRLQPRVVKSNCFYRDRAKLTEALLIYAKALQPSYRYVPVKP